MNFRDPQQAFRDAIANGIFGEESPALFMYMHSEGIQDVFKHKITRKYLTTDYLEAL